MYRKLLINKAQWLAHETAMEKGIVGINLPKCPSVCDCKAYDKTKSVGFDSRAKGLMVINVGPLMKDFATNLALYPSMVPSWLSFNRKTHLH